MTTGTGAPGAPPARRSDATTATASRAWHGGVAAVAAASLVLQLVLTIGKGLDGPLGLPTVLLRYVSYFTIQSNIIVMVVAATLFLNPRRDGRLWRVARLDGVLAITITGLVVYFVLRDLQTLTGWDAVADFGVHVLVPIVCVLGWLVLGPRPRIDWGTVGRSVIWPIAWVVYTFAAGAIHGWYPYPFLDVDDLGYGRAVVNAVLVAVLFLVLASGARLLDKALPPVLR